MDMISKFLLDTSLYLRPQPSSEKFLFGTDNARLKTDQTSENKVLKATSMSHPFAHQGIGDSTKEARLRESYEHQRLRRNAEKCLLDVRVPMCSLTVCHDAYPHKICLFNISSTKW